MKDDGQKSSIQSFEIEFSKNPMNINSATHHRLLKFEANFQRTSMIMLICFSTFSIYATVDFCYCLYLITISCNQLVILYLLDILSDFVFWAATLILYLAIKQTSVSRLKRFTYLMTALVALRLVYAVTLLASEDRLQSEECKMTSGEKVWKMILYLFENLFYVVSIGSVHYLIQLLESIQYLNIKIDIKEQPSRFLNPDIKESLIL